MASSRNTPATDRRQMEYTMVGYPAGGGTFVERPVSTEQARELAVANDLDRYFLVPESKSGDHRGYVRLESGEYKHVPLGKVLQTIAPETLQYTGID